VNPLERAAELRACASAAEASRDAASLEEVRAKHERARIAWSILAEAQDAVQNRRLEAMRRPSNRPPREADA
jgi:hypothetical protein